MNSLPTKKLVGSFEGFTTRLHINTDTGQPSSVYTESGSVCQEQTKILRDNAKRDLEAAIRSIDTPGYPADLILRVLEVKGHAANDITTEDVADSN